MKPTTTLRVARPSDNIGALLRFYRDGLGFQEIGSFSDHEGFDGIMLGVPGAAYHLELTHQRGHSVGRAPTRDHLLVFYLPDEAHWQAAIERMERHGFASVPSLNPYWDKSGVTFEDADGYRVVLQQTSWPPSSASIGGECVPKTHSPPPGGEPVDNSPRPRR